MYSQNDEEKFILQHFAQQPPARFYDIGAYDGRTFSNVRALMERGWSGVCVEPGLVFPELWKQTREFADRVQCVNAAIVPPRQDGLIEFFEPPTGGCVSTLDQKHRTKWEPAAGVMQPFWTNTLSIQTLFQQFGPAEFINLDVEGKNWELFVCLPFTWSQLRLICVEFDSHLAEMTAHALRYGFHRVHSTGENLLLAR